MFFFERSNWLSSNYSSQRRVFYWFMLTNCRNWLGELLSMAWCIRMNIGFCDPCSCVGSFSPFRLLACKPVYAKGFPTPSNLCTRSCDKKTQTIDKFWLILAEWCTVFIEDRKNFVWLLSWLLIVHASSRIYIYPPTPLNFSTKAAIFWKTLCLLFKYCGCKGLIFGKMALSSVPFSLAYSRFREMVI